MSSIDYLSALQNLWSKKSRTTSVVSENEGSECFGSRRDTQTTLGRNRSSSVSRSPIVKQERTATEMSETREIFKLGDLVWCVSNNV